MQLKFVNGDLKGLAKDIPPSGLNIGRETDNDLQLLIGGVSRYHARIEVRGTRFFIKDLGSTNGTKVNGVRIDASYPLQPGDELLIGDQCFICEDPAAARQGETARMPSLQPINQNAPIIPQSAEPQPKGESLQATAKLNAPFSFHPAQNESQQQTPASSSNAENANSPGAAPGFVFRPPQQAAPAPAPESTPVKTVVMQNNGPQTAASNGGSPSASAQPAENKEAPKTFSFGNIFAKKSESGQNEEQSKKRKTVISNLIFYLLVVIAASICISVFLTFQEKPEKNNANAAKRQREIKNPFTLYYEKLIVTPEHTVFKFKLLIENKKLSFILDDLQTGRSYAPQIDSELSDDVLGKLKEDILKTDFMSSVQENLVSGASDDQNYIRIMVGFDDKFNDLTVQRTIPNSFAKVETIIKDFLHYDSGYEIDPSIASTREELLKDANHSFQLAQDQFGRYESDPAALAKSIMNYQIAMRKYDVFTEKPEEWNIARANLAKAQSVLNDIKTKGQADVSMYIGRHEYNLALEECEKLLLYFEADGPYRETHDKIKGYKLKIERYIQKGGK